MKRSSFILPFAAAVLVWGASRSAQAESGGGQQPGDSIGRISFNRDVRPILNSHCVACHGGVKQAGGLSFVYRDKVLPPDGWVVEPSDPDASVLLERVTESDPELRMPPPDHGPALSGSEVATLRAWIEQGANWQEHWAFAPPHAAALPEVEAGDWPRRRIDYFVLRRLEQEGLRPAPDEDPSRWLRRASLDLVGLPPTPQEREEFLAQLDEVGEAAYGDFVDRKLESPHFGERWASVWLDQVRYADSRGLGMDGRRSIWKYRDWVIDALNDDMPYDQFTIKQVAGDLLPGAGIEDRIATAAHRLTQTNEEGGTDDEEFRIAAVLDRVNTTWQAWQGVTFECVQCHSHPYDPIEHDEYYRFAAFFNNTEDCDLDEDYPLAMAPIDPKDYDRADRLDRQIEQLRGAIWRRGYELLTSEAAWRGLTKLKAKTNNRTKVRVERRDGNDEFRTVGTVTHNTDFTLTAPLPEGIERLSAVRVTVSPLSPETAVRDSEWGFVLSHVEIELVDPATGEAAPLEISRVLADEPDPWFDPQLSLDPKQKRGFAAYSRINYPRQAAFVLSAPVECPPGAWVRVRLKHRVMILSAFPLISKRGSLAVSGDPRFEEFLNDQQFAQDREELEQLEAERSKIPSSTTPVLEERPERLRRPTHVFIRGLFLTKDAQVSPGTPESLPPLPAGEPVDRLALAHWLASPENPLTARVAVNRFWARVFGVGLVATEEDFGSSGDPPSHPELLDDLAARFQGEMGWSPKRLLREILLSSVYRQSSAKRPDLLERDPGNRLLACGPATRLPAEMIRDQALAVSGLLSDKMHGPPVHPPIPEGVWDPFASSDKWRTPPPGDEDRYRRAIYTYVKRSIPFPMQDTFDAPSREVCTPRRLRSNTPLQALMALNDAAMVECAEALAERLRSEANDPREQLRRGFTRVLCREPREEELEVLLGVMDKTAESDRDGLVAAATVLLNLDETLTK